MEHINTTYVVIGLAIWVVFRAIVLLALLRMMIHFQSFNFAWLPLIGAALLAGLLDTIPLVGHFIAVPALYMCIWKITRASLFPDSVFTVVVSYAVMRASAIILLAYAPIGLPTHSLAKGGYADDTNYQALAAAPAPAENSPADSAPADKTSNDENTTGISIKGVSHIGNSAMATIQCGQKNYTIALGEGVTVSTDNGPMAVHFLEAGQNSVTLSVGGQTVKYPVK
jgi:hypothetical protein